MKKQFTAILLVFCMLLAACPALAAIPPQYLPDPAEVIPELKGRLYEADCQISEDYTCDVFRFKQPEDFDAFLEAYARLAFNANYTMEEVVFDGMKAYAFISYQTAYLIPDFKEECMLLLVEKGTKFSRLEPAPCSFCDETGLCRYCEGRGFTEDRDRCFLCSGMGRCRDCKGRGFTDYRDRDSLRGGSVWLDAA